LITRLTKEQESRLSEYRDKWLAIGLSTEPANRDMAENGIREAYKCAGIKTIPRIIWCKSPLSSGLTKSIVSDFKKINVSDSVRDYVWSSVSDSVSDSVWDSVWSSVSDSVWSSVGSSVRDSVWSSVGSSVRDSVGSSVRDSVGDSVRDSVGDSVRDSVGDSVGSSCYGQHDANWLGSYDYYNKVLKLEKQTERLSGLWVVAKSAGWFLPYEKICWVSERHNRCELKDGKIHCEGAPAIQYPDGFSIWGLNGVRVTKEIAETPFDKLNTRLILEEHNAEIRREIVRKIGIERICKELNAETIEKGKDHIGNPCELLLLDLQDGRKRPYIKLENPSISCYHIEGLPPEVTSLEMAFNFRNGTNKKPLKLT